VRHVPKLMRNLIFVGQLNDKGHDVNFGGGDWRVTNGSMVVAKGLKRYSYMTTTYENTIVVFKNAKKTKLWQIGEYERQRYEGHDSEWYTSRFEDGESTYV